MAPAPVVDKRALMQAASQSLGGGAAPGPAGATMPTSQPAAAAQPLNQTQIANVVGSGVDLSQDPSAVTGIVQMLQDPGLPPDQRAELQMRLQLAALGSLQGSGPSGAAGGPGGQ